MVALKWFPSPNFMVLQCAQDLKYFGTIPRLPRCLLSHILYTRLSNLYLVELVYLHNSLFHLGIKALNPYAFQL